MIEPLTWNDDGLLNNRQIVQSTKLTLTNIRTASNEAFKNLDLKQYEKILIVLGQTDSGKSTLLTSLILGPEKMDRVRDDKFGFIIEAKEEYSSPFKIGHSKVNSETFWPTYHRLSRPRADWYDDKDED